MQDLRTELTQILDEAEWEWIIPHVQRDAVILVPIELDLLNVGIAIASDDTPQVEQWIDQQLLVKPSVTQIGEWNGDRTKLFLTLIIQPYVLIQEKATT
ncbi:MAG: DUF2288 domain-containing protein [Tolypothrix brevis GSE-NOS-MK-07-07A]|jgi:hypothetical protein|nr:DUF2288 domain-containing protein [Tolypothrix brevis GSE-NOS-MK-07-07A]